MSTGQASVPAPVVSPSVQAPHPILTRYYGDDAAKRSYLRRMFDATAGDYDRVESVLSLGSGRWYRRRALQHGGLVTGMQVLDVASGTGLVAREALALIGAGRSDSAGAGKAGHVLLLDPSAGMLSRARADLRLPAVLSVGEALPFGTAAFDFLSMGYALRHLPDLNVAFGEFHRVLRPGAKLCLLEITRPTSRLARAALAVYFRGLLPLVARVMFTGQTTRDLWTYYWDTIDACVPPSTVLQRLTAAGFKEPRAVTQLGLFTAYYATR